MSNLKLYPEHLGLAVRDTVASKDWYVHALGAEVAFDNGGKPPAFFLRFPGGLMIELYTQQTSSDQVSDNAAAGWRHLALRVDSLERARDEMSRRGVRFSEPIKPAGGGGRVLFFQDPDGNLFHLVERPQDSVFAP